MSILRQPRWLFWLSLLLLLGGSAIFADSVDKGSILDMWRQKFSVLRETYATCSLEGKMHQPSFGNGPDLDFTFRVYRRNALLRGDLEADRQMNNRLETKVPQIKAYVLGTTRAFRVDRASSGAPFTVAAMTKASDDTLHLGPTIRMRFPAAWAPYSVFGSDAPDFLAAESLEILMDERPEPSLPTLRRFVCKAQVKPGEAPLEGWFTIDEAKHWAIVEICWGKPKERFLNRVIYDGTQNGVPIMSRFEEHQEFDGQPFRLVREYDISRIDFSPPPEARFTLEDFGINVDEGSYASLYIWIMVGGIALAIAAYVIRRRNTPSSVREP